MVALCVRITICLQGAVTAWAAARRAGDRGVEVFEWAGVLILVAGIIAGVYAIGLPGKVASAIDEWVGRILDAPAE
ncbi:MAG TPA: hypothetical protein VHJ17_13385 [Thermomonospora sp.]|nr:hypothetical protein [Thermomonospora sp.]